LLPQGEPPRRLKKKLAPGDGKIEKIEGCWRTRYFFQPFLALIAEQGGPEKPQQESHCESSSFIPGTRGS